MSDVITIGIASGTGSGKTTITRRILDEFGGDVSVLYHDNYYKRHDQDPAPFAVQVGNDMGRCCIRSVPVMMRVPGATLR